MGRGDFVPGALDFDAGGDDDLPGERVARGGGQGVLAADGDLDELRAVLEEVDGAVGEFEVLLEAEPAPEPGGGVVVVGEVSGVEVDLLALVVFLDEAGRGEAGAVERVGAVDGDGIFVVFRVPAVGDGFHGAFDDDDGEFVAGVGFVDREGEREFAGSATTAAGFHDHRADFGVGLVEDGVGEAFVAGPGGVGSERELGRVGEG